MADIATIWDAANSRGDWALPKPTASFAVDPAGKLILDVNGAVISLDPLGESPSAGLVSGRDIETAVLISIFTDAVAGVDDVPPDGTGDPRGWWGDDTIGCKVWLRSRAKQTPQTLLLVKADFEAALTWLVTDGVAASVTVTTEWTRPGLLGGQIVVRRTDGADVAVAFEWAWKEL
jgi:phage gp46-like protein